MRTNVEDEDMLNRLHSIPRGTALHVLQLHTGSKLTGDSEKHGIHTLDLGDLNMDKLDNRETVAMWVREMQPACIIGSPKGKTKDHFYGVAVCTNYK